MSAERKVNRRRLVGMVVSDKQDKTIVVAVVRKVKHKLYNKYLKKTKKFHAHDEENSCQAGDTVKIMEHRPISKKKTWVLEEVLEKAR